jgi:hypothetical protein
LSEAKNGKFKHFEKFQKLKKKIKKWMDGSKIIFKRLLSAVQKNNAEHQWPILYNFYNLGQIYKCIKGMITSFNPDNIWSEY